MACYAKPDFITTVVITLAILFLNDTEDINRDKFRLLPLVQLISIVYDFVWLFFVQNLSREGASNEGGLELPVKLFALQVAYIAFIFKVSFLTNLTLFLDNFLLSPVESELQLLE